MYFFGSFLKSFRHDLQHNFTSCPSWTKVCGFIWPLSLISSSVTTHVLSGYGFVFLSAAWRFAAVATVKAAARTARPRAVKLFMTNHHAPFGGSLHSLFCDFLPLPRTRGRARQPE